MYCKIYPLLWSARHQLDRKENPDSFIAFLKVLGECEETLQTHLNSPTMKNAAYLFPDIQNKLTNIVGIDLKLNRIQARN